MSGCTICNCQASFEAVSQARGHKKGGDAKGLLCSDKSCRHPAKSHRRKDAKASTSPPTKSTGQGAAPPVATSAAAGGRGNRAVAVPSGTTKIIAATVVSSKGSSSPTSTPAHVAAGNGSDTGAGPSSGTTHTVAPAGTNATAAAGEGTSVRPGGAAGSEASAQIGGSTKGTKRQRTKQYNEEGAKRKRLDRTLNHFIGRLDRPRACVVCCRSQTTQTSKGTDRKQMRGSHVLTSCTLCDDAPLCTRVKKKGGKIACFDIFHTQDEL